jgi:hypothetical protein
MKKYFDWRIDSDKEVHNLLWLREYEDGTIKVVREYNGVWQWDKEKWEAVDRVEPNIIANSNHNVTDTCLGEAAIKAWKANGSPSKVPEKTKEYIADIFMAPASVMKHLTHGGDGCPNLAELQAMGVEVAE